MTPISHRRRSAVCVRASSRLVAAGFLAAAFTVLAPASGLAKYASLILDADSGRVLHAVNADTRNYPASLTKMMTLYMVFEALEEGRWSLGSRLPVSARAARQPSSRLGLLRGQTITVENAILAMVTKSANDVATVVAEALGGSERKFALMMTAKARRIGMSRTTFRNASGLPHRGQLSTARDLATLARALLVNLPGYYHYFSTTAFRYRGVTHKNHNELLETFEGTGGVKTGYIRASGYNLVASVKREDYRLIGVILGGRSPKQRNRLMVKLLNKGFRLVDSTMTIKDDVGPSPSRSNGTARPAARWGIQVGAYKSYAPAYAIARQAMEMAPHLLEDGIIKVVPLKMRNRRSVYRARILGLSKQDAYRACRVLKRHRMSCMELRLKEAPQLASARR